MEERDWHILQKLYECKNITRAAKELYISQPALTARIKYIESTLGVSLFLRSNKGIVFTEEGEFTVRFAKDVIQRFKLFREQLAEMSQTVKGVLRIAAPHTVIKYYLPPIVKAFTEEYPEVRIFLMTHSSSETASSVRSGKVHFGFIRSEGEWDPSEQLMITEDHMVLVSAKPFTMEELPLLPRVDYLTDSYYRQVLDSWWAEHFKKPPTIDVQTSNLETCREMIYRGVGYGVLPSMVMGRGGENMHTMILKDKQGKILYRHTYLIYKKEILQNRLAEAFFNFIKERSLVK